MIVKLSSFIVTVYCLLYAMSLEIGQGSRLAVQASSGAGGGSDPIRAMESPSHLGEEGHGFAKIGTSKLTTGSFEERNPMSRPQCF